MITRNSLLLLLGGAGILAGGGAYETYSRMNEPSYMVCLNAANLRVPEANCGRSGVSGGGGGGGGRWGYYNRGSTVPAIGEPASGASGSASPGVSYSTAEAGGISRGGFGARGGGGEGGGGGE